MGPEINSFFIPWPFQWPLWGLYPQIQTHRSIKKPWLVCGYPTPFCDIVTLAGRNYRAGRCCIWGIQQLMVPIACTKPVWLRQKMVTEKLQFQGGNENQQIWWGTKIPIFENTKIPMHFFRCPIVRHNRIWGIKVSTEGFPEFLQRTFLTPHTWMFHTKDAESVCEESKYESRVHRLFSSGIQLSCFDVQRKENTYQKKNRKRKVEFFIS